MINAILGVTLWAIAAQAETAVIYSDEFSAYYPEIVASHPGMSAALNWEKPVVEESPLKTHRASFMRTDGTSVPQEKSIGTIVIRPPAGKMQFLFFKRFRSVSFSWINERLLHVEANIDSLVKSPSPNVSLRPPRGPSAGSALPAPSGARAMNGAEAMC